MNDTGKQLISDERRAELQEKVDIGKHNLEVSEERMDKLAMLVRKCNPTVAGFNLLTTEATIEKCLRVYGGSASDALIDALTNGLWNFPKEK